MKHSHLFDLLRGSITKKRGQSRNCWIQWFSIALAIFFLYLALKGIDWASFKVTLRTAQYGLLPIALAWSSLSYFIRALRWRVLLSAEKPISRLDAFWANMSGYLGNNILPARAGELIRAVYANRTTGLSLSFALASGLSERLLDVIVLILLGTISLSISNIASGILQRAIQIMATVAGIAVLVFLLLPGISPLLTKMIGWIPLLTLDLKEKLSVFLEKFLIGLRSLLHPLRAATFSLYTVLIWLMDGLNVVLMGYLLHIPITLPQAFVLLAAMGLSSAIPSTPGYVGVYQLVAILVLVPFGLTREAAIAFMLVLQISGLIVILLWGNLAAWKISRNISSQHLHN